MTEANYTHAVTSAPKARKALGSTIRLAIAAVLGLGIGFYVAKTASDESSSPSRPAAAASPATRDATGAQAAGGNGPTGYFPDQFVNQAKEIEPQPPEYH